MLSQESWKEPKKKIVKEEEKEPVQKEKVEDNAEVLPKRKLSINDVLGKRPPVQRSDAKSQKQKMEKLKPMVSPSPKKEIQTKISGVFQNCIFYFDPKNAKEFKDYRLKIREHSGKIIENLKSEYERIYYVLPDCEESGEIMRNENMPSCVRFVSSRWIDYCIAKKECIINIQERKLINLLPFSRKIPFKEYKGIFCFAGGYGKEVS